MGRDIGRDDGARRYLGEIRLGHSSSGAPRWRSPGAGGDLLLLVSSAVRW